jgi:hypothetical protein
MNIGDMVIHTGDEEVGIITYLWDNGDADILIEGCVYQVDSNDLEVVCEAG